MVRWLSASFVMATMVWGRPLFGQAQDPREIQARKDCLTGKVDAGVALLAELFAETTNPNFIYNQARCYQQNGRAEDAINRFREYLRVAKNITPQDRAEVDKHIADCQAMQAERQRVVGKMPANPSGESTAAPQPGPAEAGPQNAVPPPLPAAPLPATVPTPAPPTPPVPLTATAPPPPTLPVPPTATAPTPPPATAPTPPPAPFLPPTAATVGQTATAPAPATSDGAGLRVVGTVSMVLGLVGVAAGAVFSGLVLKTKDQVESDANNNGTYDPALFSRGQTYETLQWVAYGTGGALMAAGVVLYVLGARRNSDAMAVSLVPSVAPSQGGVLLRGRF